ncbi:MAG: S8 family serine peptidase [Ignavibacteriae bacterium]|nr:S8 family serine peptidase [Ignavibacteriota bacterium]
MKHITIHCCLLATLILLLCSPVVNAQTSKEKKALKEFAKQEKIRWTQERTRAESLATAKGLPIRIYEYLLRPDSTGVDTVLTMELQRFQDTIPIYYKTMNLNAAKTISTNKVWTSIYNLSGKGIKFGVWDDGIISLYHPEFDDGTGVSRVTNKNPGAYCGYHATPVGGTIIASGLDPNAKGMSYKGKIDSYDWNDDKSELATAANNGLLISNHSYGATDPSYPYDDTYGMYSMDARRYDEIANNAWWHLIVKAAGNSSYYQYDGILADATAKNILTVGAVDDLPNGCPSSVPCPALHWGGSNGPTDDGRIKPDIVANGNLLRSSAVTTKCIFNVYTDYFVGTSAAAASVTGSIGLLMQHKNNLYGNTSPKWLSSTWKALVIHTADDAGNPGPDYEYGWGVMNTRKAAVHVLQNRYSQQKTIYELPYQSQEIVKSYIKFKSSKLKATICWTDQPGIAETQPYVSTSRLVNDLDLKVSDGDFTFYPWILDPNNPHASATACMKTPYPGGCTTTNTLDNVEQVVMPPRSGWGIHSVKIRITHKGQVQPPGVPQKVSLIVSGGLVWWQADVAVQTNKGPTFNKVKMTGPSDSVGVALGRMFVVRCTDRGASWGVSDSFPNATLNDISFTPKGEGYGWIVGGSNGRMLVVRCTDRGASWASTQIDVRDEFQAVTAMTPALAYAVSKKGIFWTTRDSGQTWQLGMRATPSRPFAMDFPTAEIGYIVGAKGIISRTTDGGNSFSTQTTNIKTDLFSVSFANSFVGCAVGKKGIILRTTDGGGTWSTAVSGVKNDLFGVKLVETEDSLSNGIVGYAVGKDGIALMTVDSGATWDITNELEKGDPMKGKSGKPKKSKTLYAVDFTTDGIGAAVGDKTIRYLRTIDDDAEDAGIASLINSTTDSESPTQSVGEQPQEFTLYQNYPNPFNPTTVIRYQLPVARLGESSYNVTLKIFNVVGQEVATLVDDVQTAGYKSHVFHAASFPSGIYFYRLTATPLNWHGTTFTDVKKLLLMK